MSTKKTPPASSQPSAPAPTRRALLGGLDPIKLVTLLDDHYTDPGDADDETQREIAAHEQEELLLLRHVVLHDALLRWKASWRATKPAAWQPSTKTKSASWWLLNAPLVAMSPAGSDPDRP